MDPSVPWLLFEVGSPPRLADISAILRRSLRRPGDRSLALTHTQYDWLSFAFSSPLTSDRGMANVRSDHRLGFKRPRSLLGSLKPRVIPGGGRSRCSTCELCQCLVSFSAGALENDTRARSQPRTEARQMCRWRLRSSSRQGKQEFIVCS